MRKTSIRGQAPGKDGNGDTQARDAADELDAQTLQGAQHGDEDACRALVQRYQDEVFARLSRVLGPQRRARTEELARELFLDVLRSLEALPPLGPARVSAWVLGLATRRAADALGAQPAETSWPAEAPPAGFAEQVLAARRQGREAASRVDHAAAAHDDVRRGPRISTIAAAVVTLACLGALALGVRQASRVDDTVIAPTDTRGAVANAAAPPALSLEPPAQGAGRAELLARDQAQRDEIAALRARLERMRRAVAAACAHDGSLDAVTAAREAVARLGLSATDAAALERVLAAMRERWSQNVRALCVETADQDDW